ncbi:hypothetical protein ACS0PU_005310 [Formica fusca]
MATINLSKHFADPKTHKLNKKLNWLKS